MNRALLYLLATMVAAEADGLFKVVIWQNTYNNKCRKIIHVWNTNVIDNVVVPCSRETEPITLDSSSLYVGKVIHTTNPDSLLVVRGETCEERKYSVHGVPPTVKFLVPTECTAIRLRMGYRGEDNYLTWGKEDEAKDLGPDDVPKQTTGRVNVSAQPVGLFKVLIWIDTYNNKCRKTIHVWNTNVKDNVLVPCSRKTEPISVDISSLDVGSVIHTTEPDSLVVLRGDKCEKRSYGVRGGKPTVVFLESLECDLVKGTMGLYGKGNLIWGKEDEAVGLGPDDVPEKKSQATDTA